MARNPASAADNSRTGHIELADRLNVARSFVECAYLAVTAATVERDYENALMTVLDEAVRRIKAVAEEIAALGRGGAS